MITKDGSDFCCFTVIRDYEGNYIPLVVSLIFGGGIRSMLLVVLVWE